MNNYRIPKRARRQLITLAVHPPAPGVPEDPKDNMERISILQQPYLEMKWEVNKEMATIYGAQSTSRDSTDNHPVNPASQDAPFSGSSHCSSSLASDTVDAFSAETNQDVLSTDEQNDADNEPAPASLPVAELNSSPSPATSSRISNASIFVCTGSISSLDSQETTDRETFDADDEEEGDDDEVEDHDVLIIGLSKRERKEVDSWNKLLARREQE